MTRNMFLKSILCISIVVLTALGCSASRDIKYISAELQVIEVDSMPDIKILSEIRVLNDQVYLTYESKGGYGQRHIKQYVYDSKSQCLSYDKELFKKDDGFYQLFAPSLFEDDKGDLYSFDRDMPSIYSVSADGIAVPTKNHLITTTAKTPYTLVHEARQAFFKSQDEFLFIGRNSFDGEQILLLSQNYADSIIVDEICKITYDKDAPSWMANFGKATYNQQKQVLAFVYQLYPTIQFFKLKEGKTFKSSLPQSQNLEVITEGADIWEQNCVQYRDITSNEQHIYALYWGEEFGAAYQKRENDVGASQIMQYDWDGNLLSIFKVDKLIEAIGVSGNDGYIICYDGDKMYRLCL